MSERSAAALARRGVRRRQALGLAAITLALLGLALGFLRVNPFSDRVTVHAVFDDARGVAGAGPKTTTEVRLAGAKVGDVEHIERIGDQARFTLEIDEEAADALRRDASAELRPRTPFEGNSYIDLDAGSAGAPLPGTIPRSQTHNYVSLYEALSFARPPTRQATRELMRELRRTLAPDAQQGLQQALREAPRLTRDLAPGARALRGPRGDELTGAVQGAATTFSAVAERERSIAPFLRGAEQTSAALATDQGGPLDASLRALPATLRSLVDGGRSLTSILDRLDPLAEDLEPGLRELPVALRETRPLVREAIPVLTRAVPLVRDLRAALATGADSTPAAQALLQATRPTLDILNESLLDALHRRTPVGLPAYLALLNTLQGAAGAFATFQDEQQARAPGQVGTGHFVHFEGRFYSGYATPELPSCTLLELVNPELAAALAEQGACVP